MSQQPAGGPKDLRELGPSTRAVHAGVPEPVRGAPLLPGPSLAAPFHLPGDTDGAHGYTRFDNPSWALLESALGELEGGEVVLFASGMAALSAALLPRLGAGDVLVAPADGYPGVRSLCEQDLAPRGVEVRLVATDTDAIVAATPGATVVWIETPSNPRLDVCDLRAVAAAASDAGAKLIADNTLATPLGQRPLELGASMCMVSGTKALAGHSDMLLGYVACRDGGDAEQLRAWRSRTGGIASPFEAWLAHRSLATLALRLERSSANALALAGLLIERGIETFHPSLDPVAATQMDLFGPLVCFTLSDAVSAQSFLAALELVAEATSFGGVHSTAERRGRWGTDAVPEGFIRFSAGCEDTADLLADVARALDRSGA